MDFQTLAQHLYAQYPNEETKPWIRELILVHEDYDQGEHRYEFQRMIWSACEHFGETLLTEAERTRIFDAIRRGPSKENFRGWMEWGRNSPKSDSSNASIYFHRKQFRPFEFCAIWQICNLLPRVRNRAPIADEDYPPFKLEMQWTMSAITRRPC